MSEVIFVGVDPGLTGAVAVIHPGEQVRVVDLPTICYQTGRKTKKGNPQSKTDYDGNKLVDIFAALSEQHHNPDSPLSVRVALENVHAMNKGNKEESSWNQRDTGVTAFSLGRSRGIIEAMLWAFMLPFELVSPSAWRPAMVGRGTDKEAARIQAQRLFPQAELHLKKHHGRAEALLIAEYYRRKYLSRELPVFQQVLKTVKVAKKKK